MITLHSTEQKFNLLSNLIEEKYSSEPGDSMCLLERVSGMKRECNIGKSNQRDRPADVVNKISYADLNKERQTTEESIIIRAGEASNNKGGENIDGKHQNKNKERSSIN